MVHAIFGIAEPKPACTTVHGVNGFEKDNRPPVRAPRIAGPLWQAPRASPPLPGRLPAVLNEVLRQLSAGATAGSARPAARPGARP